MAEISIVTLMTSTVHFVEAFYNPLPRHSVELHIRVRFHEKIVFAGPFCAAAGKTVVQKRKTAVQLFGELFLATPNQRLPNYRFALATKLHDSQESFLENAQLLDRFQATNALAQVGVDTDIRAWLV